MTVWQIAAGDGQREYSELFLRFGLACVGPGDPGPFGEHRDEYQGYGQWSFLRPFCEQLAPHDLIVLKGPCGRRWRVIAVGRISGEYAWDERLEDVEGWDLQHTVAVTWRRPPNELVIDGLVRGTLRRVNAMDTRNLLETLWKDLAGHELAAEALPDRADKLDDEMLISGLVDQGIATGQAEAIQRTIWRIRRLAGWYGRHGGAIGEHEIRTFLIVPLLLALGWPEQRIKIEHEHTDIALWDRPFPHEDSRIELVIETKRLWDGLGGDSVEQAKRYAARYEHCRALVVSDGFRYKLLRRDGDDWNPAAYANLLKLEARHPTDQLVAGADGLFLALLPNAHGRYPAAA